MNFFMERTSPLITEHSSKSKEVRQKKHCISAKNDSGLGVAKYGELYDWNTPRSIYYNFNMTSRFRVKNCKIFYGSIVLQFPDKMTRKRRSHVRIFISSVCFCPPVQRGEGLLSALRSTVILSSDSCLIEKGHCKAKSNVKLWRC